MEKLSDRIKALAQEQLPDIIELRRLLHSFPELAFEEYKTGDIICEYLDKHKISYQRGIARTGIVALISGNNPRAKTIALRADMDALPIFERNHCDYCSKNEGKMHACGHDIHMASLLGTASILNKLKKELKHNIKFIFQPSEEKYPGGASIMIKEGVLDHPKVYRMIGQHVHPAIPAGKIGLKPGTSMASTDEVYITVSGKGGHAATPELNTDPIVVASHIIIALQNIVSRMALPTIPTVLSFGKISGNGKTNIIPDEVFIEGTLRTVNEDWRNEAHEKIRHIAENTAAAFGASCQVFIDRGYPFLLNDEKLTARIKQFAVEYLGHENVLDIELRMTAEDFAYYSHKIPSCFYRLGVKDPSKKDISNLHTATFSPDESSLETGMGLMAWLVMNEL